MAGRDQPAGSSGPALNGWLWLLAALVVWSLASIPVGLLAGQILRRRRKCDSRHVTPED